jgi:hypothetical protein
MWPAVILAASRNDRVNGRTIILVVSIRTRNGFNQSGAPSGRKCAVEFLGLKKKDEMINLNHRGSAKDKDIIRCLDNLNVYGIIPARLIIIININKEVTIKDMPFRCVDEVR